MPKMIAVIIETVVLVCALWLLSFMAIFMHELGHALGYMLSTLNRHWHIRVGSGKRLLKTKRLTVKLLVFDGEFIVAGNTVDSKQSLYPRFRAARFYPSYRLRCCCFCDSAAWR